MFAGVAMSISGKGKVPSALLSGETGGVYAAKGMS
jgi:hypothetical protein